MNNAQIKITDHPDEADWQLIEDHINRFNIEVTGKNDYRPLASFIRDPHDEIIAGITGFTWGGTLRITALWVHENQRKHGYGTKLLVAAEQEARARGCKQAVLETHSFQAPAFYPRHGYTICGITDDFPVGYQQIIFQKNLLASSAPREPGS